MSDPLGADSAASCRPIDPALILYTNGSGQIDRPAIMTS